MWNRREISASSHDDQSHDFHPHPHPLGGPAICRRVVASDAGAVCGGLCESWQASELQPNETLAEEDWGWMEHRGIDESTPREVQYATAYYWAITVLSTVGYGDISAHTPAEMMVSGVAELVGCFLFAMLIGSIGGEQRAQTPAL
eukprot:COSAG01_NODE_5903_length_3962_cov_9.509973_3_plen_145_part_00